jgi:subtilisin family serine protease
VSWASEIVPVRITNRFDARAYVSDMMACLVYGATVNSDVINLSYITYDGGGIFPGIIWAADYANNAGSVVVIAAGNDSINPAPTQDPDSILYVAATTSSNTPASFSNYGTYVDIAAPGVSITTTYSAVSCTDFNNNGMADPGECVVTSNGYASAFGTSFSAPLVAGGVLLLRSVTPSLPPASTRALLCQFATELGPTGEDQTYGCGLLNLQAALQLTQAPVSTLTVTTPNGGESWRIGSKQEIRWTTGGLDSKVRIELSRDTGASWTTLTQNTPNNGLWRWQVTKPSTTQGLIRVTNLTNPAAFDVTDAPFAITQ